MGMLMVLVGQVMTQVVDASAMLRQRFANADDLVAVRRMLHRDLMDFQDAKSLEVDRTGVSFVTTHNLLLDGTLPVTVTWSFDDQSMTRTEVDRALHHKKTLTLLRGVRNWTLEYHASKLNEWVSTQRMISLRETEKAPKVNALRLTLFFEQEHEEVMVERVNAP